MSDDETLAQKIWDGREAEGKLEMKFCEYLEADFEFGYDSYDSSIEIYNVPKDFRLTEEAQKFFFDNGFSIIYVNHEDGWETHYHKGGTNGWRVNYHNEMKGDSRYIEVEKSVKSWPKNWEESGFVRVKE
jgi:hypothetical protein